MLVLTRLVDQAILIGDDIRVVICDIRSGGKVRIGIEAPRDIQIIREELQEAKRDGEQ